MRTEKRIESLEQCVQAMLQDVSYLKQQNMYDYQYRYQYNSIHGQQACQPPQQFDVQHQAHNQLQQPPQQSQPPQYCSPYIYQDQATIPAPEITEIPTSEALLSPTNSSDQAHIPVSKISICTNLFSIFVFQSNPEPLPLHSRNPDKALPSSVIDHKNLKSTSDVIGIYPKLRGPSKLPTLAVKLAREAVFGQKVMTQCTPLGLREKPGLPLQELLLIKKEIFLLLPDYWGCPSTFESVWADCIAAIGQACKRGGRI